MKIRRGALNLKLRQRILLRKNGKTEKFINEKTKN